MKTLLLFLAALAAGLGAAEPSFTLTLQTRKPAGVVQTSREIWPAARTAVIVCDMWDLHHCKNAVIREAEMAPRMNAVLEQARTAGALIIHAPSGCMAAYAGTPARKRAQEAPAAASLPPGIDQWCKRIPAEEGGIYPLDDLNGGEDDEAATHAAWAKELEGKGLNPKAPWTRQTAALRIDPDKDAVSDSGQEIWNLLEARGIRNVILMGVHINMCVSGRPFGLRQLAKNGKHVVLMRDLTDSMYNPKRWPFVSHVRGTALFIEYLEKRVCPTVTSDQILGGAPFAFSDATAGEKRLRVLLLGDSTTEAKFPKLLAPDEPQLEDTLRILLALEPGLPPVDAVNLGLSGEFIRRLLDSGRYDQDVATQPSADFICIRYGLNDIAKRENFEASFPADFKELLARLRKDHPEALLIPTSVIPCSDETTSAKINALIRQVAAAEKLPYCDVYSRYLAELKNGGMNALNYRRYPLAKIPPELQPLAMPYLYPGKEPEVVVLDNRLDGVFGQLPGWYGDRHPNLAGYNVIASETARFLAPLIRGRKP